MTCFQIAPLCKGSIENFPVLRETLVLHWFELVLWKDDELNHANALVLASVDFAEQHLRLIMHHSKSFFNLHIFAFQFMSKERRPLSEIEKEVFIFIILGELSGPGLNPSLYLRFDGAYCSLLWTIVNYNLQGGIHFHFEFKDCIYRCLVKMLRREQCYFCIFSCQNHISIFLLLVRHDLFPILVHSVEDISSVRNPILTSDREDLA